MIVMRTLRGKEGYESESSVHTGYAERIEQTQPNTRLTEQTKTNNKIKYLDAIITSTRTAIKM